MGTNPGPALAVGPIEAREIALLEHRTLKLAPSELTYDEGVRMWTRYDEYLKVEFPSPKTEGQWTITPGGWVGHLPVSDRLLLRLAPKVPISSIFRMWDYAYRLRSFRFLDALVGLASIEEYFDELASVLAKRVLDRARRGFYRSYVHESDRLLYVRGTREMNERLRQPWTVRLPCRYQEHTADIDDNQILLWTLRSIARGYCSDRVVPRVRQAYRSLAGVASLEPHRASACAGRLYHRLNDDYEPLHALCRFFLEHSAPTHEAGDRSLMPFVVDMARLFELFVAEWLRTHLPAEFALRSQETRHFGERQEVRFDIDLVVYDAEGGRPRMVLDTKYKTSDSVGTDDVAQVVAYAEALGCREAALVYPSDRACGLDVRVGGIRVRSLAFELDGDLEAAGWRLLDEVLLRPSNLANRINPAP